MSRRADARGTGDFGRVRPAVGVRPAPAAREGSCDVR